MRVIYERCCEIDVHKKMIVVCLLIYTAQGIQKEIQTFSTMLPDLYRLRDWLKAKQCQVVAMESTGIYWRPIWNVLEGEMELLLVNAQHIKAVAGRKTDIKDAAWIADLLQHGLLRELRELTRYRSSLVGDRARLINRIQKVLEDTNIKLASVATDITGKSGRAILQALLSGEENPEVLAELDREIAHRLGVPSDPEDPDPSDGHLASEETAEQTPPAPAPASPTQSAETSLAQSEDPKPLSHAQAIRILDVVTGINVRIGQIVLAELGTKVDRFPTEAHLCSWAGLCPAAKISAGKRLSNTTGKGNRWLRQALIEAAQAAARSKGTFLGAYYQRLRKRMGHKKAIVALAHRILVIIYHLLKDHQPYRELGPEHADEQVVESAKRWAIRRLEQLGYHVTVQPTEVA